MTLTELSAALNASVQDVNGQIASNPTAPVVTQPLTQIVGANSGYVFNTGVFTICAFLGGDPNIPGT